MTFLIRDVIKKRTDIRESFYIVLPFFLFKMKNKLSNHFHFILFLKALSIAYVTYNKAFFFHNYC